jgi:hypothetical protein
MSEQTKQEWRIEIGRMGTMCRIFVNGHPLHPHTADLHMEVGRPSTLSLKFPMYGLVSPDHPTYRDGDIVVAEGNPKYTYLEIDDRRFRLMEIIPEGDLADGLFGERRTGD